MLFKREKERNQNVWGREATAFVQGYSNCICKIWIDVYVYKNCFYQHSKACNLSLCVLVGTSKFTLLYGGDKHRRLQKGKTKSTDPCVQSGMLLTFNRRYQMLIPRPDHWQEHKDRRADTPDLMMNDYKGTTAADDYTDSARACVQKGKLFMFCK